MAQKERLAHRQAAPPSRRWNLILILVAALSLAWALTRSVASKGSAQATAAVSAKATAPGQLIWTQTQDVSGSLRSVVWGDPLLGAYGAWNRWPGGADAGTHTQSADLKMAVMSGTFVLSLDGGPEKELPAGSFIQIPAHQVRSIKCKEGSDCTFFAEQPDKHDFIPAKPPEKK